MRRGQTNVGFRPTTGTFPRPGRPTTTRIDKHTTGHASGEAFGIGERIASCPCMMFSDSLREDLFASTRHPAMMHAISFVRLAVTSARRALCAIRGHDMFLHFEPERLSLRCMTCGAETMGWRIDVDARFRGRQRRLIARRQRDFATSTGQPILNRVRQGRGSDSTAPKAA